MVQMPHYIPYLALVMISILLFMLSWFKAKSKKLIPFYLTSAGLVYLFEYFILVLFRSYQYSPGVFQNNYFDNILGANVSDGFIVPSISVFIAVFDLGFWWIILISFCFYGIEELFLHLHVYRHFWWKTIYTSLSLLFKFYLAKWIWKNICLKMNHFLLRLMIIYFTELTLQATAIFYYAALFHLVYYRVGWFDDSTRDHIAFATLYILIRSLFFSYLIVKKPYWWNAILLVIFTVINFIFYKLGILEVPGLWAIGLLTFTQAVIQYCLFKLQKVLVQVPN